MATLPFMALFMFGAALAFTIEARNIRVGVAAFFLFSKSIKAANCLSMRIV